MLLAAMTQPLPPPASLESSTSLRDGAVPAAWATSAFFLAPLRAATSTGCRRRVSRQLAGLLFLASATGCHDSTQRRALVYAIPETDWCCLFCETTPRCGRSQRHPLTQRCGQSCGRSARPIAASEPDVSCARWLHFQGWVHFAGNQAAGGSCCIIERSGHTRPCSRRPSHQIADAPRCRAHGCRERARWVRPCAPGSSGAAVRAAARAPPVPA